MSKPIGSKTSAKSATPRRALSVEQLDDVSGGGTSPAQQAAQKPTQETSKDPYAQTVIAAAELAHSVDIGNISDVKAMHELETLAQSDHVDVTKVLLQFADDMTKQPGHLAEGLAVGAELGKLMASNQVDPTNACKAIENAVANNTLPGTEALLILAGIAESHSPAAQQAAANSIVDFLHGPLQPADCITFIETLIRVHDYSADQGLRLLFEVYEGAVNNPGPNFDIQLPQQIMQGVASMIDHDVVSPYQAGTELAVLVTDGAYGQAVNALLDLASLTEPAAQVLEGRGFATAIFQGSDDLATARNVCSAIDWATSQGADGGVNYETRMNVLFGIYASHTRIGEVAALEAMKEIVGFVPAAYNVLNAAVADGSLSKKDADNIIASFP